jgi:hypothetical protein
VAHTKYHERGGCRFLTRPTPVHQYDPQISSVYLLLEHYSPLWTLASDAILKQLYRLLNKLVFTGLGCKPNAQPPAWRTRVFLLVWNLTLDLSGLGDPASSYATARTALETIGARKPHRHKAETPPVVRRLSVP